MIYEYLCTNDQCKNEWEAEQKISDDVLKICPECNLESAKRLISNCNFALKGGGWAQEGYSKK